MNQESTLAGEPESQLPQGRAKRHGWLLIVIVAGIVLIAGTLLYVNRTPKETFAIPEVDLEGVDFAIVNAIKSAEHNVEENPYDGDAWGHLAMVLYAHQANAQAAECFAIAAKMDSKDHRWPYLRGMILAEENTADGLPYVRRALQLVPENTSLKLRLAELLFDVRSLEESETIFRDVLKSDPDNPRAKLGLARVLSISGDPREALRWAAGAARTLPDMRATHELLAKLLYRTGKKEAARKQLQFVDRLPKENLLWPDPILAEVILLRVDKRWLQEKAHRLMAMGQSERYIQALQRVVAEDPDNASMHAVLGRTMLSIKNLKAARSVLENALRKHPDSVEILYLWGVVHFEEHHYQEAAKIYQDVVARKPDYPEVWNALAECQQRLGDREKAIESYRQVLHYEPFFPNAHVGLAELLARQGDREAAVKHLKTALELAPTDPAARKLLKKIQ